MKVGDTTGFIISGRGSGFRSAKLQNLLQYRWRKIGRSSVMRNLSKCMLAASLFGANVAYAEPITFHTQTFSDQTTVTMAVTSSSALSQQEYDYGVTINLIETDATGLVYHDNGLHKALVKCREVSRKDIRWRQGIQGCPGGRCLSTGQMEKRSLAGGLLGAPCLLNLSVRAVSRCPAIVMDNFGTKQHNLPR